MDKKSRAEKRKKSLSYKSKYNNKVKASGRNEEPPLPSNWSKYKIKDNDTSDEERGANFKDLLNAPVSSESYFKFKSEQDWDETNVTELNENFNFDLKLLEEGISCIPFNVRHNIDDSMFCKGMLEVFKTNAAKNLEKYKKTLSKRKCTNLDMIMKKNENATKTESSKNKKTIKIDDIDDLNKNQENNFIAETAEVEKMETPQLKENLEQWLDDILEN